MILLPQTLEATSDQVSYFEFGKNPPSDKVDFNKLSDKQLQDLTKPTYYCPSERCRYQDSPIAEALRRIVEQPPNELGLVITDLFLSNSEVGGRELQLPLTKALREGRAIAFLALKTATTGPIYDLTQLEKNQCFSREKGLISCENRPPQYIGATSRPLFVIMIGPLERVIALKQKLDSDFLKQVPQEQQRFTIFARQGQRAYSDPASWPSDMFPLPMKAEKGAFLDAYFPKGFPGQQITLTSRSDGLTANIDLSRLWTPGVPPPETITLKIKTWFQKGNRCERMWFSQAEEDSRRLVKFEHIGGLRIRLHVAQPSPREAGLIPNLDAYLISGKLTATGFQLDPWFNDWGYNEPQELQVLEKRPAFFPAKNLPRIGKVLVDIIQEDAEPVLLGEFRLAVKVK
jgi:hypothetical protein